MKTILSIGSGPGMGLEAAERIGQQHAFSSGPDVASKLVGSSLEVGLSPPNPEPGLRPRTPLWYVGRWKEPRMATAEEFRRLALALEGTPEARHVDRAAFRVARIFATLAPDGATANLRLAPDEQELKCLLRPAAFAPVPNRWGAQGWTTVRLDTITLPELRGALELAWRLAQPRRRTRRQREKTG